MDFMQRYGFDGIDIGEPAVHRLDLAFSWPPFAIGSAAGGLGFAPSCPAPFLGLWLGVRFPVTTGFLVAHPFFLLLQIGSFGVRATATTTSSSAIPRSTIFTTLAASCPVGSGVCRTLAARWDHFANPRPPGNAEDATGLLALMQEMRQAFGPDKMITLATQADMGKMTVSRNVPSPGGARCCQAHVVVVRWERFGCRTLMCRRSAMRLTTGTSWLMVCAWGWGCSHPCMLFISSRGRRTTHPRLHCLGPPGDVRRRPLLCQLYRAKSTPVCSGRGPDPCPQPGLPVHLLER
jgi:hypothetical protein